MVDAGLVFLFGLQHSVMARVGFKQWLYKFIPAAAERSTYVLLSGIIMLLAIALWQPLPGTVWELENTAARIALWTLYALAWSYLFAATFVTNHFEPMGLHQVYMYFLNVPYSRLPFVRKYLYRYSRHPMMLGMLVGLWSVPTLSVSHFALAVFLTFYIAIGMCLEERDLVRQFGNVYAQYKKEIAALIPKMF